MKDKWLVRLKENKKTKKQGECEITDTKRREYCREDSVVNLCKTITMVDGDRKMTLPFHNREFTEDLDKWGEFSLEWSEVREREVRN